MNSAIHGSRKYPFPPSYQSAYKHEEPFSIQIVFIKLSYACQQFIHDSLVFIFLDLLFRGLVISIHSPYPLYREPLGKLLNRKYIQ
jgi:hypothetical protein